MNYDKRLVGHIIGRLRTEQGLSQEVLSGLAGIARSHLAMIECGRKNPNVQTLWKISWALGMPLSQLIRIVESETGISR